MDKKSESSSKFSIKLTHVIKGVAIILLLIHHTISNNTSMPILLSFPNVSEAMAASFKVCVCLFTIMSGFGITMSWKNKNNHAKFIYNHIIKLWFSFAFIYVFYAISLLLIGKNFFKTYGTGFSSVFYAIKDFAGLQNFVIVTPTLSGVWWYMEAIFVFYLLFPILYKIIKKGKIASYILLLTLYIPWIHYMIFKGVNWHTDREIFYLFSFCLGVYCAEYKVFDKIVDFAKQKHILSGIISTIIVIAIFVIRTRLCLVVDPFFALSIITFSICVLSKIFMVSDGLVELGKASGAIYMFHGVIRTYMSHLSFSHSIYRIIVFVFICWATALLLSKIKEILGYEKLVNKITK